MTDTPSVLRAQRDIAVAALKCIAERGGIVWGTFARERLAQIAEIGRDALPSRWQPIETAPKDGSAILLHVDWAPLTVVGFWGQNSQEIGSDYTWRVKWDYTAIRDGFDEPTHWKPLREPPQEDVA